MFSKCSLHCSLHELISHLKVHADVEAQAVFSFRFSSEFGRLAKLRYYTYSHLAATSFRKLRVSGLHFAADSMGLFIRLAVVASQKCELAQNSVKI